MRGFFIKDPGTSEEEIVRNRLVDEGAEAYLQTIFQAANPLGTHLYIGLMTLAYERTDGLADITEPTHGTNGYARQQVTRDATDWPDISKVNGVFRAESKQVTFAASGGDFDQPFQRLFITNAASGTSGLLIAVSGAFAASKVIVEDESVPFKYQFWTQ